MLAATSVTEAVTSLVHSGTLAYHLPEWILCTESEWILQIVERGYELQFLRGPQSFSGLIRTRALGAAGSASHLEIKELQRKGAIRPVGLKQRLNGFYSKYFLVPKSDGSLPPILDLRRLNSFLQPLKFKMLTPREMLLCINPGDYMASIDLKDAYFHVTIAERHRKYLRFLFEGQAWEFTALPFGLSLAPRVFPRCTAALSPL